MRPQHKNFLLNVGYQCLMYVFPLVTSAYTSRVLGPENLGIYAYVNSIVTICGMFGLLGISNYGNRAVAEARDNRTDLSTIFSSIYTLQLLMSAAVIVIYGIVIFTVPMQHKKIFFIQILYIVSVALDVTWFFYGIEKFRVPLTKNLFVKVVSFALIVLLVKSPDDLGVYSVIMCGSSVFSQTFLLILARKEVDFCFWGLRAALAHFKKCCVLFIPVLAYSIYRVMDKTMIGSMCEKSQLGFYENAERVISIPIMVISALGTVMMPYLTHLSQKSNEAWKHELRISMKISCGIAAFAALGLCVIARDTAIVLFGSEYETSGYLMILLASTIIASAWSNVIRTQYLIPFGMDRPYVISTMIGAVINLVCNLVCIPIYKAAGACIGTILAEFSIVLYQTVYVRKKLEIKAYFFDFFTSLLKAAAAMSIVYMVGVMVGNIYMRLLIRLCLAMFLFVVTNKSFILKEFLGISKHG